MRQRRRSVLPLGLALLASVALVGGSVSAADINESKGFRKAVTLAGIREHQAEFQAIADDHDGNRVGGSAAYNASRDYVVERMEAAGYDVTTQAFQFLYNADATPPTLRQETPTPITYVDGPDYQTMTFSESISVDDRARLGGRPGAAAGARPRCNHVRLRSDRLCRHAGGVDRADAARAHAPSVRRLTTRLRPGAVASIIFNDGGDAGRVTVIAGTLGPGTHGPAVGTTLALGQDLANGFLSGNTGSVVTIRIDRAEEIRTTHNVIAETPGAIRTGSSSSVPTSTAASRARGSTTTGPARPRILEIAEVFAAQEPDTRNKLRFMWYGAEEFGLLGSQFYVEQPSQAERDKIMAMVNFDMVGSPNYVRFVYDGDNSAFPVGPGAAEGPPGSAYLETLFVDYFNAVGLANDPTPFSGRSDYGPFIAVGIPAGGLFTGAEGIKTAAQAATYGGTAGIAVRPVLPPGMRHVRRTNSIPGARSRCPTRLPTSC